jgi:hypothetical protein
MSNLITSVKFLPGGATLAIVDAGNKVRDRVLGFGLSSSFSSRTQMALVDVEAQNALPWTIDAEARLPSLLKTV